MSKGKFDLTTQKRNKKGVVISSSPYRLHVDGGVRKFERPPGSGMFYAENGELMSQPKKSKEKAKATEEDLAAIAELEAAE